MDVEFNKCDTNVYSINALINVIDFEQIYTPMALDYVVLYSNTYCVSAHRKKRLNIIANGRVKLLVVLSVKQFPK